MDKLLEKFKQFELSKTQVSEIKGGEVIGCRQSGTVSYEDRRFCDGSIACDVLASVNDPSGWCPMQ